MGPPSRWGCAPLQLILAVGLCAGGMASGLAADGLLEQSCQTLSSLLKAQRAGIAGEAPVTAARKLQQTQVVDDTIGQPTCLPSRTLFPGDAWALEGTGGAVGSACTMASGIAHTPPTACGGTVVSTIAYAWSFRTSASSGRQKVAVTTCGATTDNTVLTVRQGCSPVGLMEGCSDDTSLCGNGQQSAVGFIAEPDTVYTIFVQLWGFLSSDCWYGPSVGVASQAATGSPVPAPTPSPIPAPLPSPSPSVPTVSNPSRDTCASPTEISPGDDVTLTTPLTSALGNGCTDPTGVLHTPPCRSTYSALAEVWTIVSTADQTIQVETCSQTSLYDTILTVRDGCSATNTSEGCNDDGSDTTVSGTRCGLRSTVSFLARAGSVYTVYLHTYSNSACWTSPSIGVRALAAGSSPVTTTSPPLPIPSPVLPLSSPPAPLPSPIYSPAPQMPYTCTSPYSVPPGGGATLVSYPGATLGDGCTSSSGVLHIPPCRATYSTRGYTWALLSTVQQVIQVQTCTTTTTFDTILTVRGGCSTTNTTAVWCNDDASNTTIGTTSCGRRSVLNFTAEAGSLYSIYLHLGSTDGCWFSPSVVVSSLAAGPVPGASPLPGPTPIIETSPAPGVSPAPRDLSPTPPGTSPAPPGGMESSTITFTLTLVCNASVKNDPATQQQFLADLTAQVATYLGIPLSQVQVVLGGRRRQLLQSTATVTPKVTATPTWPAGDTATPARLQQQLSNIQANPGVLIPASMAQQYGINTGSVALVGTPQNTPTPAPAPPSPSGDSGSSGLPLGAIIGIAVGGGVLLLMATGLTVFLCKRKRKVPDPAGAPGKLAHQDMAPSGPTPGPNGMPGPDQGVAVAYVHGLHPTGSSAPYNPSATGASGDKPLQMTSGSQQTDAAFAVPPAPQTTPESTQPYQAPENLRIAWSDVSLNGTLGAGSHGQVFKGSWLHSEVAVKMLTLSGPDPAAQLRGLQYVAQTMRDLHHPTLARIFGLVEEPAQQVYALVMQLYRRGTLAAHIASPEYAQVPLKTRLRWAIQIADAMSFLHSKNPPLLHLDLKNSNILLQEGYKLVISDFGVAACLDAGKVPPARNESAAAITPPEVWSQPYIPRTSPAMDVYAFGTVLWEIMAGQQAFQGQNVQGIQSLVVAGRRPAVPAHVPRAVADIIQDCWREDITCRPPFSVLVGRLLGALQEVAPQEDLTEVTTTLTTTF